MSVKRETSEQTKSPWGPNGVTGTALSAPLRAGSANDGKKRRKGSKRYGDITGYWRRGQVMLLGICILVESYLCDGWPSDI